MNRTLLYRYQLEQGVPVRDVEDTLFLAVLATESLHGAARVRLDASFCLDTDKRTCVIDAGTEVGQDLARLFTGFLRREFGEAFRVERIVPDAEPVGAGR